MEAVNLVEVEQQVGVEVSKAEELAVQAENLTIHNKEGAVASAEWLKDIKRMTKELESKRDLLVRPLNNHVKLINGLFKQPKDILSRTEAGIKRAMLKWTQAEQARIREEQEKARKAAEAAQKKKEAWAKKAEERGDEGRAEELREQAEEIVPETSSETVAKPEGIYTQKRWKAEVTDLGLLINAVLTGQVAEEAVTPNQQFLDGLAKRLQGNVKIPGVKFYEEETVAARM